MKFSPSTVMAVAVASTIKTANAFVIPIPTTTPSAQKPASTTQLPASRSRISDPHGPSPSYDDLHQVDTVEADDIPGLRDFETQEEFDAATIINPHQPWRRGDMNGCDDPIVTPWRQDAERAIKLAAELVGGRVIDVTWYLTAVLITLDDTVLPSLEETMFGNPATELDVHAPRPPVFHDPADPNPDPIWADEDEVLYRRQTPEERLEAARTFSNRYAPREDPNDPDDPTHIPDTEDNFQEHNALEDRLRHNKHEPGSTGPIEDMGLAEDEGPIDLYMNEEGRAEVAIKVAEEAQILHEERQQPMDLDTIRINTPAISIVATAILDALKLEEDNWRVLGRHEVVLSSPGPPDVLETQLQFDAHRGTFVSVETQDPWESNRTIRGHLVDRNSMDVYLNQQGRMVTIPLNFVKCVRLPASVVAESSSADGMSP